MSAKVVRIKPDEWQDEIDELIAVLRKDTTIGVTIIIHEKSDALRAMIRRGDCDLSLELCLGRMRVLEAELIRANLLD